ncbi:hypothetical protein [Hartmannibacter diazotrophicus]|uniref:hypothetical protein n=1 Tax=Hartmannibacter diazotrophicus TaxID=1482074 RepID=UPI00138FCF35|nr:hypothetical protein [Hartmannibacter diazotrophicus]
MATSRINMKVNLMDWKAGFGKAGSAEVQCNLVNASIDVLRHKALLNPNGLMGASAAFAHPVWHSRVEGLLMRAAYEQPASHVKHNNNI